MILLSAGYAAARGGVRLLRDSLNGFLWWAGILAALGVLVSLPAVLVWVIRIGAGVAIAYALYLLLRSGYLWICHVPEIQRIRRKHVLSACGCFGPEMRKSLREAAMAAMEAHSPAVVLGAVAELCGRLPSCSAKPFGHELRAEWRYPEQRRRLPATAGNPGEQVGKFVREQCDRTAQSVEESVQRLQGGEKRRFDRLFIEDLVLRFGREPVERGLKLLEKEKPVPRPQPGELLFLRALFAWFLGIFGYPLTRRLASREQRLAQLAAEEASRQPMDANDVERRMLLRSVGVDVPVACPAGAQAKRHDGTFWLLAFAHPVWAYLYLRGSPWAALTWFCATGVCGWGICLGTYLRLREFLRAALFAGSSAALAGYGIYLMFSAQHSAGWVFTAAFGVLYMTALLNVGTSSEGLRESGLAVKEGGIRCR
jgi:hypothetical protein